MLKERTRPVLPLVLVAVSGVCAAHNHVTVDTPAGLAGDPVLVDVGYLPAESGYSVDAQGVMLFAGQRKVYSLTQVVTAGEYQGWYSINSDQLTLTSDFNYISGRLGLGFSFQTFTYQQPGDFRFEVVQVVPVCGQSDAVYAHGVTGNIAESDGASREEKSFAVGVGEHQHNQRMYLSRPGVYDITLRAWDAAGIFQDEETGGGEVTFRVSTGHAGPADLAPPFGTIDFFDLSAFLSYYGAADPAADFAAPLGTINFFDVSAYLAAYSAGCP